MTISVVSIILYGILGIIGGFIGYKKAGSKISLISGIISGLLLLLSSFVTLQGQKWGLILGLGVAGILVIVFAVRFVKTRKFMPAGLMSILGLVVIFSILKNF